MTASNRSLQWREKVIDPLFESRTDHMIMYQLADKLGFGKELVKSLKLVAGKAGMMEPEPESMLVEINRSNWTIGYTGQCPERLKAHMRNMNVFDVKTLRAKGGVDKETGYKLDGDYFGLPWPCYGTPEIKHPGSPNLYDTSRHVMDGGGNFRANFGIERDGVNLLAEDGSYSKGAEITTGYPEFDHVLLKKLGWWDELTDAEKKAAEGKNWKTDLSGGIQRVAMKSRLPSVRQRQGARGGLELPRPGAAAPRAALFDPPRPDRQVPDARRQEGLLAPADALQERAAEEPRTSARTSR